MKFRIKSIILCIAVMNILSGCMETASNSTANAAKTANTTASSNQSSNAYADGEWKEGGFDYTRLMNAMDVLYNMEYAINEKKGSMSSEQLDIVTDAYELANTALRKKKDHSFIMQEEIDGIASALEHSNNTIQSIIDGTYRRNDLTEQVNNDSSDPHFETPEERERWLALYEKNYGKKYDSDINDAEASSGEEFGYGEITTKGGNVIGFSTSYVCDGGSPETVRSNLGDGWHVRAVDRHSSYGVDWYELYDTDDGDYYGWVDGDYITWYN